MNVKKHVSTFSLVIVLLWGCESKRVNILGTASGITDAVIEVSTKDTSWLENINQGKFALDFMIQKEEFAQMKLIFIQKPKKTKSYLIYLEEGGYEITFDSKNLESYPQIESSSKPQKDVSTYYNLHKGDNKNAQTKFISGFPNSLLSAYFLSTLEKEILDDPARFRDLYGKLGEDIKKTDYGKKAGNYIENCLRNQLGAPMPKLFGVTLDGDSLDTSRLVGKLTLLVFWASWNYPSVKDIPMLKQFYDSYKMNGLEIVGIAIDKRESRWKHAINYHGLNWLHVSDFKGAYSKNFEQYNTNKLPYYVLIGPDLRIVEHNLLLESLPIYMREYQSRMHHTASTQN